MILSRPNIWYIPPYIPYLLNYLLSRLALKVEGLARVSKNAGGRPRLASVAFDGRYMGLAL